MIIKKYIVNDMKEALVRAKYELGGEAIILSQRMIRTGKWYQIFKKKELEVTVAIEEVITNEVKEKVPDVIISNTSDTMREKYISYCKLHGKDENSLTIEEQKDFFKIILQQTSIEKKLDLGKINVLVGPTGVGKTTTIAKIAAREYLINKKKVGLITIDTYRIGAVEQLKTYANILNIAFEVVNEPKEMEEKLRLLSDCDTILIDTLGTSHKDDKKLDEIQRHLEAIKEKVNTYLVLSISTDKDTIASVLEKYKALKYDAFIITKLDEVNNMSNLWYILENNSLPLQYICYGQDVPDDIQLATLDNLYNYCGENFNYDGSSK